MKILRIINLILVGVLLGLTISSIFIISSLVKIL